ncbi:L10-interacting MYB domain-containing protein-like isoform X2 [Lotus japonicus]|uniref:L10-interacting MYB domain-containing protein-like isoform X2 n=1 Tax=Lotus japonicus TaxID=34305 RepID=UPI0025898D6F|nr:L10-interacting MYB domain-containing protein-like isoform X2 [Lotus japonicus]XP_057429621.1 L10-interacting MYB domain-containing protein-like isoform X2 [Lotus japonicus]XP_057429622.1 L10-interacting MYB domain-containing protein-like isoform X2 [Lotus japonicus]
MDNSKATWDFQATKLYVKLCLAEHHKGERLGSSFTKKGWISILTKFNASTGRNYDKPKLKNKWDNFRREWQAWYKLFEKETGLGWDKAKNTVDAPDEWWEKKQLENPLYGKYREKGLSFGEELTIMFKDVVATGKSAWAPTSGILPNDLSQNDDVYRPCLESDEEDREEGSGDSEELIYGSTVPSVGVSNEFQNINFKYFPRK